MSHVKNLARHSAQDPLRNYLPEDSACASATVVDDQHLLPAALAIEAALADPEDQLVLEHKRFSVQAVSIVNQPSDTFDSSDPFSTLR